MIVTRSLSSGGLGPRTRDSVSIHTERVRKISVRFDLNDIVARVLQIELGLFLLAIYRSAFVDINIRKGRAQEQGHYPSVAQNPLNHSFPFFVVNGVSPRHVYPDA
jgi:hypothetical protein